MARFRHVILFTWYAYGTWIPDRPEGYYRNKQGLHAPDADRAEQYRRRQRQGQAHFGRRAQRLIIDELIDAARKLDLHLYATAADPAHVHVLVAWNDSRLPRAIQRSLKHTLSQRLNKELESRSWFTRRGHDRRVRDRDHFENLREEYLPSHRGLKWDKRRGLFDERFVW